MEHALSQKVFVMVFAASILSAPTVHSEPITDPNKTNQMEISPEALALDIEKAIGSADPMKMIAQILIPFEVRPCSPLTDPNCTNQKR